MTLAGCPLEEKISEFQQLKAAGNPVGALAVICIDNPMAAATGHRICNDCMKSCIYQKQDPVDIPQVETRTLKDVLGLPWGFEIYGLLTRWNPLNLRTPLPRPRTGRRVLIVGMGPAGFSLAHHLMNDGHTVVGIDGLKIEPLPDELSGVRQDGTRVPFAPIRDAMSLYEALDERVMAGFGGVAEYGITVRWDKNFLKLVRLLIERRAEFALYGGVRFGGTITLEDAFGAKEAEGFGFDHVALCMGAGRPTTLDIPNGLARGVRTASDFLMALQLTGAAQRDSIANMQVRLPVIVIGGGLTAIDTATESLAYYVVQVEKFLDRYHSLAADIGEDAHPRPVERRGARDRRGIPVARAGHPQRAPRSRACGPRRADRGTAQPLGRRHDRVPPAHDRQPFLHAQPRGSREGAGGGRRLRRRPDADRDRGRRLRRGRARSRFARAGGRRGSRTRCELSACTVFIAAGTQPNTVLAREDARALPARRQIFPCVRRERRASAARKGAGQARTRRVLLTRLPDGRFVSYFGDLHPSFFGNVVKALGSTKQGYPVVSRVLAQRPPASSDSDGAFIARLDRELRATVHEVKRLTPTIVELIVKAPAAARRFRPGQFYRLQNFATRSTVADGTLLQMEGLALTGAWVDPARGPRVDDRARNGRLVRSVRAARARRAGRADGTDRQSDPHPGERDRDPGRRGPRQCGAVLDRAGVARRRIRACSISPATRRTSIATRSPTSRPRPTSSSGAATKSPDSSRIGRRTSPSSATSSRPWKPTRPAGWARRRSRCPKATTSSPSARTG